MAYPIEIWNQNKFMACPRQSNLDVVLDELKKVNYTVKCFRLKAKDYGLPQNRERVYIVCVKNDALRSSTDLFFETIEKCLTACVLPEQNLDSQK